MERRSRSKRARHERESVKEEKAEQKKNPWSFKKVHGPVWQYIRDNNLPGETIYLLMWIEEKTLNSFCRWWVKLPKMSELAEIINTSEDKARKALGQLEKDEIVNVVAIGGSTLDRWVGFRPELWDYEDAELPKKPDGNWRMIIYEKTRECKVYYEPNFKGYKKNRTPKKKSSSSGAARAKANSPRRVDLIIERPNENGIEIIYLDQNWKVIPKKMIDENGRYTGNEVEVEAVLVDTPRRYVIGGGSQEFLGYFVDAKTGDHITLPDTKAKKLAEEGICIYNRQEYREAPFFTDKDTVKDAEGNVIRHPKQQEKDVFVSFRDA